MSEVRAVFFDMDGVLVDSMRDFARVWTRLASEIGVPLTEEDILLREGEKAVDSVAEFFRRAGKPVPSAQEAQQLLSRLQQWFFDLGPKRIFAENCQIARKLRQAGIPVGLVTGNTPDYAQVMLGSEILGLFDPLVSGADVPRGKPFPDGYLLAAARAGVDPGSCLAIENAPTGIRAAHGAGMRCAAFTSTLPAEKLGEADFIFDGCEELIAILKRVGLDVPMTVLYFCAACGRCCEGRGDVVMEDEDVRNLAAHLKVSPQEFVDRFCRLRHSRKGISLREGDTDQDCVFLKEGRCQVYDARPKQCRLFPNGWHYEGFEQICRAVRVIV